MGLYDTILFDSHEKLIPLCTHDNKVPVLSLQTKGFENFLYTYHIKDGRLWLREDDIDRSIVINDEDDPYEFIKIRLTNRRFSGEIVAYNFCNKCQPVLDKDMCYYTLVFENGCLQEIKDKGMA